MNLSWVSKLRICRADTNFGTGPRVIVVAGSGFRMLRPWLIIKHPIWAGRFLSGDPEPTRPRTWFGSWMLRGHLRRCSIRSQKNASKLRQAQQKEPHGSHLNNQ